MKTCFAFIRLAIISVPVLILAACGSSGGGGGGGTVNRNDVNLASLAVSSGTLTPAFSQSVTAYAVEVPNTQTTITVTAEAVSDSADVTINGTGNDSSALSVIELEEGLNTATVTVRAPDATEKTYTITITRLAPGLSSNANLAGLELSSGTLTPAFSATTTSYTAEVANTVTSITVTPTVAGINATVKVNNVLVSSGTASGAIALSVGINTVTVEVTAEDGTKKTYTVTATRLTAALSNNANLSNLSLSAGTLNPVFSANTISYSAEVDNSISSITVTPTVAGTNATVKVNTVIVTSGTASGPIALSVGNNTVTVEVTAEDGTKKTYTVTMTRQALVVINLSAISGVTPPVLGAVPVTTITETSQYTGTVTWDGGWAWSNRFGGQKAYTATITLTAKSGYTLTGVAINFFTVAGTSSAATNSADSGVVTAIFPATASVGAIGSSALGGKVAYILQSGDTGYVAGEQRGLIAATTDQSTGIIWAVSGYQSTSVPGGTGNGLGAGLANTDRIIAQNGPGTTYAAGLARAHNGGGYIDWYLPSIDELKKLYVNRATIGGFAGQFQFYWSSSQSDENNAICQDFVSGSQTTLGKFDVDGKVRAVRSF